MAAERGSAARAALIKLHELSPFLRAPSEWFIRRGSIHPKVVGETWSGQRKLWVDMPPTEASWHARQQPTFHDSKTTKFRGFSVDF
jgi:hypothetical protein